MTNEESLYIANLTTSLQKYEMASAQSVATNATEAKSNVQNQLGTIQLVWLRIHHMTRMMRNKAELWSKWKEMLNEYKYITSPQSNIVLDVDEWPQNTTEIFRQQFIPLFVEQL